MKVKLQKEKKLISSGDDSRKFNYSLDYSQLNLRRKKSLYRVGRGEQGVLLVQPYKSEILPYWKFRDPGVAKKSSRDILKLFRGYCAKDDFIGISSDGLHPTKEVCQSQEREKIRWSSSN
jgi:hypothetical protein